MPLRAFPVVYARDVENSPRMLAGVQPGLGPRHELFACVPDTFCNLVALAAPPQT